MIAQPGAGPRGVAGRTILNGAGAPDPELGAVGDFYLSADSELYGPKDADTGWGAGVSLVGPQGDPGDPAPLLHGSADTNGAPSQAALAAALGAGEDGQVGVFTDTHEGAVLSYLCGFSTVGGGWGCVALTTPA
jgi:hypothetical protein